MGFRIVKTESGKAWGDVDKSSLWARVKRGLQEGADGIADAIREVYAVLKNPVSPDLTESDCWGPHHEITEGGDVRLNRGGLVAAVAALSGARSEPDLSPDEKAKARAHLLKHYRELEMPIPASLGGEGEFTRLGALVSSEIAVESVPLGVGINVVALKDGDPDPMEVVVEIPSGKSKLGWNYTMQALQDIGQEVMERGLLGFLGHQKPENLDHEFPKPVTHWVGAKLDQLAGKLYLRGVVDKTADDLKRWIKAGSVRSTSIFGVPKLETSRGETRVVGYKALSNDWSPPGREGMSTKVIAWGEIDSIITAEGGEKVMSWEVVAKLKDLLAQGEVTLKQVAGELGLTLDAVGEAVDEKAYNDLKTASEHLAKVKEALSVAGEMDVVRVAKEASGALTEKLTGEYGKLVDAVIGEKVSGEIAQTLVRNMLKSPEGSTKEEIAGEIDKLLADEKMKSALSALHLDNPVLVGKGKEDASNPYLQPRQVRI